MDWRPVIFNMLTIKGHLRPGDVRDLVQDVGDAGIGRGYFAGDYASVLIQGL